MTSKAHTKMCKDTTILPNWALMIETFPPKIFSNVSWNDNTHVNNMLVGIIASMSAIGRTAKHRGITKTVKKQIKQTHQFTNDGWIKFNKDVKI